MNSVQPHSPAPRGTIADDIRAAVRDVADFPKTGILFKDVTPLLLEPALLARTIEALAAPFRGAGITHVAAVESRGFLFGPPVALVLGAAFVPIRKPGKLPARVLREDYALEYGNDALEIHADALHGAAHGEPETSGLVLVLDDVLATGGTAAAACRLVERAGGSVVACVFVLELTFLHGRAVLGERRVEALVRY